jgi:hypothetical protein
MDAPLQVGFERSVAPTFLAGAVLEAVATGVMLIYGIHPAILLVMVPGIALTVAYGLQSRGLVLTVDSEGIATRADRLSWAQVEDVSVDRRSALVVTGAGRRVTAPLAVLDTPRHEILLRIEREWGRPVPGWLPRQS